MVLDDKIARAETLLREAVALGPAALSTSLSAEDMALSHLAVAADLPVTIFTLQTGRLHPETLAMIDTAEAFLRRPIARYEPDPDAVRAYVQAHGANAFYDSVELRKMCCGVRKVEPLRRALAGKSAWITGLRRDQAQSRSALREVEPDPVHGLMKFSPLVDWSWDEVMAYVEAHRVPINPLHARGYPSIGCEPCTRAVRPHEDPRAGRWWWEQSDSKECGLHVAPAAA